MSLSQSTPYNSQVASSYLPARSYQNEPELAKQTTPKIFDTILDNKLNRRAFYIHQNENGETVTDYYNKDKTKPYHSINHGKNKSRQNENSTPESKTENQQTPPPSEQNEPLNQDGKKPTKINEANPESAEIKQEKPPASTGSNDKKVTESAVIDGEKLPGNIKMEVNNPISGGQKQESSQVKPEQVQSTIANSEKATGSHPDYTPKTSVSDENLNTEIDRTQLNNKKSTE